MASSPPGRTRRAERAQRRHRVGQVVHDAADPHQVGQGQVGQARGQVRQTEGDPVRDAEPVGLLPRQRQQRLGAIHSQHLRVRQPGRQGARRDAGTRADIHNGGRCRNPLHQPVQREVDRRGADPGRSDQFGAALGPVDVVAMRAVLTVMAGLMTHETLLWGLTGPSCSRSAGRGGRSCRGCAAARAGGRRRAPARAGRQRRSALPAADGDQPGQLGQHVGGGGRAFPGSLHAVHLRGCEVDRGVDPVWWHAQAERERDVPVARGVQEGIHLAVNRADRADQAGLAVVDWDDAVGAASGDGARWPGRSPWHRAAGPAARSASRPRLPRRRPRRHRRHRRRRRVPTRRRWHRQPSAIPPAPTAPAAAWPPAGWLARRQSRPSWPARL